jgi:hypothetical protein
MIGGNLQPIHACFIVIDPFPFCKGQIIIYKSNNIFQKKTQFKYFYRGTTKIVSIVKLVPLFVTVL